ncbi:MAG: hypothetical protein WCH86_02370 [Kiritimatiellales bacterium]
MNGLQIGAAVAAVLVAVLGLILDRRDKRKAAEREIKTIPDNPVGLARFRQWVRDTKAKTDRDF